MARHVENGFLNAGTPTSPTQPPCFADWLCRVLRDHVGPGIVRTNEFPLNSSIRQRLQLHRRTAQCLASFKQTRTTRKPAPSVRLGVVRTGAMKPGREQITGPAALRGWDSAGIQEGQDESTSGLHRRRGSPA